MVSSYCSRKAEHPVAALRPAATAENPLIEKKRKKVILTAVFKQKKTGKRDGLQIRTSLSSLFQYHRQYWDGLPESIRANQSNCKSI